MTLAGPQGYYAVSATHPQGFAPLRGRSRADLCIIGAGYTGLSAALHAAQAGATTIVLEAESIGFGASGRNGGQIHSGHRWDQIALEHEFGEAFAHDLWDIAQQAKSLVRALAGEHAPDCGMKDGLLVAAHDKQALEELAREAEWLENRYRYPFVRMLSAAETAQAVGSAIYPGGRHDGGGGHLHPLRYAYGLATAASARGATIHEKSRVVAIDHGGSVLTVRTAAGSVDAAKVVLACDAFAAGVVPDLEPFIGHVESFIVATEPLSPALAATILPSDWAVADTRHVLDYYRKSLDGRLLFAGRESYFGRQCDIAALVRPRMLRVFPSLEGTRITHAWSGTVGITRSRLPHFGKVGERLLFGHGYSGHGVALSTMGGKLLAEEALGGSEAFQTLAALPAKPFPGPRWARSSLMKAGLLWYKILDAI